MKPQNYANHRRWVPSYHYFTGAMIVLGLGLSIFHAVRAHGSLDSLLVVILFVIALPTYLNYRSFALRAQDRAIRSEENFRHFVLTQKPLPKELRMGQVIALRFASDEEFVALAKRAVAEDLAPETIKKAVVNWRADHHRA